MIPIRLTELLSMSPLPDDGGRTMPDLKILAADLARHTERL